MPDFSIICCISDPEVFDKCLLSSLKEVGKDYDWEIIPVMNHNNVYSASNALNAGLDVSKSDNIIFVHQDIRLLDNWFEILERNIQQLPEDWGILGCAGIDALYGKDDIGKWGGALEGNTVAVGSIWDSDETLDEEPYWNGSKDLTKVHCIDECLFVMNKKTGLRFDPQFNGFHFYGVDMSLSCRAASFGCYASHLPLVHYGKYSASLIGDNRYWVFLRFLHNKWKLRFPELYSTHMHWADGELTSYISMGLSSGDLNIDIKAMGVSKAVLTTDKDQNFIEDLM